MLASGRRCVYGKQRDPRKNIEKEAIRMYITREEDIRYVILLSVVPGAEMTDDLIRAHVGHLKELDRQGRLVLCGPFTDYRGGMVIIKAASYEEAKAVAESDPYVKAGVETYELRTWELSCESNNHMGMG